MRSQDGRHSPTACHAPPPGVSRRLRSTRQGGYAAQLQWNRLGFRVPTSVVLHAALDSNWTRAVVGPMSALVRIPGEHWMFAALPVMADAGIGTDSPLRRVFDHQDQSVMDETNPGSLREP